MAGAAAFADNRVDVGGAAGLEDSRERFEDGDRDVGVGIDVRHVIVFLERVEKPKHCGGIRR